MREEEGDRKQKKWGWGETSRSAGCKVSPGYDMWIWGCHEACEVEIIKN